MPDKHNPLEVVEKGVALFFLSEKGGETMGTNLFKKRILYTGRFVHPRNPDKWLNIVPEHFKKAIENFKSNTMDRVNFYFTHNEDPRNLAGKVMDLVEGIDASDGKPSLYAIIEAKDKKAVDLIEKNNVGVSAGIDHYYREHLGGKDVGLTIKHVALVGEGWIKRLGDFVPVPRMQESVAQLSEHQGGVIYFEEEQQEGDKQEDADKKKKDEHDSEHLRLKEEQDKKNKGKGATMPTRDEIMAGAKELGLVVLNDNDHKSLVTKANQRDTIFDTFKGPLHLGENDDVAQKIIDEINSKDDRLKTIEAEAAFTSLLSEKKVLPAQKDSLVKMFKMDKEMFTSFTNTLKPNTNGVSLGEEGKEEGQEQGGGDTAAKHDQAVKEGLKAAHSAGIHLSDEDLVLIGVKK